jgi:hypothetical protein
MLKEARNCLRSTTPTSVPQDRPTRLALRDCLLYRLVALSMQPLDRSEQWLYPNLDDTPILKEGPRVVRK